MKGAQVGKLTKEKIESASLPEQLALLKFWRPRTAILLRAYSSFKQIRVKARIYSALYVLPILLIFAFVWFDKIR